MVRPGVFLASSIGMIMLMAKNDSWSKAATLFRAAPPRDEPGPAAAGEDAARPAAGVGIASAARGAIW